MLVILGSGRSGTTWLGKLFDSHPDTVYLHEPDAVKRCTDLPKFPSAEDVQNLAGAAADYLEDLKFTRTPGVVGVPPFFQKNYRGLLRSSFHKTTRVTSKGLRKMVGRKWAGLPVPIAPRKGAKGLYVLKSVSAVCRAPLFAAADPHLKCVHLIRHVGGRIASVERTMAAGLMTPDPQIEELFELPEAELYPFTKKEIMARSFMDKLAYSWMVQNDKAAADMKGNPQYLPVIYEDLCEAPADRMAVLFAHAGLEPAVQTMLFLKHLQRQSPHGGGRYQSVMKSPKGSINRWREDLSPDEQDSIMEIAQYARTLPVRKALGLKIG